MSLAVSSERTHCRVGPRRAQMDATVVPQEPPPKTTTFGSRIAAAMVTSVLPPTDLYRRLVNWRRTPLRLLEVAPAALAVPAAAHSVGAGVDGAALEGVPAPAAVPTGTAAAAASAALTVGTPATTRTRVGENNVSCRGGRRGRAHDGHRCGGNRPSSSPRHDHRSDDISCD